MFNTGILTYLALLERLAPHVSTEGLLVLIEDISGALADPPDPVAEQKILLLVHALLADSERQ